MRPSTLDLLVCPRCRSRLGLSLSAEKATEDGEVLEGTLACPACRSAFPITGGIARFVSAADDYCGNFGFQWRNWKTIQIDRLSGHRLSETRFFRDSRWSRDWIAGRTILDAGCGAGRFADVAAANGARVVAVDLSDAIDVCREITAVHGDRVECIQASLLEMPFRDAVFDGIYCMGVIQHTPDPAGVMRALPSHLKPGGRLAYNFYEESLWRRLQLIKYAIRLFTRRWPVERTLALSRALVRVFFPLTAALSRVPKVRILNHFVPIAGSHIPGLSREQQYTWTLLDTFDWYAPRYELCQRHRRVRSLLEAAGLQDVDSEPGLAWGTRPDR